MEGERGGREREEGGRRERERDSQNFTPKVRELLRSSHS